MGRVFDRTIQSPLGPLLLSSNDGALTRLSIRPAAPQPGGVDPPPNDGALLDRAEEQLAAYFDGSLERFDLSLGPQGTPFQRLVWEALLGIPLGTTRSYGDIATQIGRPKAVRAVGAANGANPIAIIIPCHRVIGSDGSLTGFGAGIEVKRRLLDHERLGSRRLF